MTHKTDTEIPVKITDKISTTYIISLQHRKTGNPNKSVWTINYDEELECFKTTKVLNWIDDYNGWGIKVVENKLQNLGKNYQKEILKLAKFIDASKNDIWHGYPADYLRRVHDRPPTTVLKSWVDSGYISKSKMSKIRQGQSCNL